jgi:ribulose 1,5-bisphosphate synthetase/thiazole synthase
MQPSTTALDCERYDVIVLGAGYAGLMAEHHAIITLLGRI